MKKSWKKRKKRKNIFIILNQKWYLIIIKYNGDRDICIGESYTTDDASTLLYPASSLYGKDGSIFQTEDIEDDGSAKAHATFSAATNDTAKKKVYYVDVPLFILTTGSEPVKVAINQEKSEIIKIMKKYTKQ